MKTSSVPRLFGSARQTQVLILVALLEDTYPTEVSRLLGAPLFSVQKIINALDREGILATRISGKTRRVSLDPRHYAYKELKALLERLAQADPALLEVAAKRISRPRRAGKHPRPGGD